MKVLFYRLMLLLPDWMSLEITSMVEQTPKQYWTNVYYRSVIFARRINRRYLKGN